MRAGGADCVRINFDDLGAVDGGPPVFLPPSYHGLIFSATPISALVTALSNNKAVSEPADLFLDVVTETTLDGTITVQSANGLPFDAKEIFYASDIPGNAQDFSVTGINTISAMVVCQLEFSAAMTQAAIKPVPYSLTPCANVTALLFATTVKSPGTILEFDDFTVCGPGVTAAV